MAHFKAAKILAQRLERLGMPPLQNLKTGTQTAKLIV